MTARTGVLGLMAVLAVPAFANADNVRTGGGNPTGAQASESMRSSDDSVARENVQQQQAEMRREARGGGPQGSQGAQAGQQGSQGAQGSSGPTEGAGMNRAQQMARISPHIITVKSQLDSARAQCQGLQRLTENAQRPMPAEYGESVSAHTTAIQSMLNTANTHMNELRTNAQTVGALPRLNSDFAQADQAMSQARQVLGQIQQQRQSDNADPAQLRTFSQNLNREITSAKSAVDRIERGIRQ